MDGHTMEIACTYYGPSPCSPVGPYPILFLSISPALALYLFAHTDIQARTGSYRLVRAQAKDIRWRRTTSHFPPVLCLRYEA